MGWVTYKDTRVLGKLGTYKLVGRLPIQLFEPFAAITGL